MIPKRWRLIDQPLSLQFWVAGSVVALFSLLSVVLLLSQVREQAQASRWVGQTHKTIGRLNTLGRDFYRQQTSVLDYLHSHDNRSLMNVYERRQLWEEGAKSVRELTESNPSQTEFYHRLVESYGSWLKLTESMLKKNSADPEALKNESALFKDGFLIIDRMIDAENRLLLVRDRKEKGAIQATFTAIAAINVLLLVIFGIVLTKLYYSIARPISDLSLGMSRYRKGDFKARVTISNRSQIGFLEGSFNEMAENIENMVRDLRKLDQLKTEFVSTVSHELRTPLTSIGGYVKLLTSGDAGPVTETQREFLNIIDVNVVRLTHLINDILDVEKMESGNVQLLRKPQDLISVLKECRDTFEVLARQKGLTLKWKVPETMKAVQGDRVRLVQIFMNLLSNAIKYTKTGSVEIEAEEHGFADVVKIRDSGVGLTPQEQEKLFEKFYRARSGLNSGEGGTGLGLVIVRGLVEAHHGTISVESVAGKGTTFTVSLPVTDEPSNGLGLKSHGLLQDPGSRSTVWIVDPNAQDAAAMKQLIEGAGPAFNGQTLAAQIFGKIEDLPENLSHLQIPMMVILDPGSEEKGISMAQAIRKRTHRTLPILAVSASVDMAAAFAEGASALLAKPIRDGEFLAAVRSLTVSRSWRVLVADPNTDVRILIKRALEQKGLHVDDVERGGLVLHRLEQERYDLVVMEMDLPDVASSEVMKAIRRSERFKDLSVFMISEEGKSLSHQDLATFGANRFIEKSRGIDGIVSTVCDYLETEERRQLEQSG